MSPEVLGLQQTNQEGWLYSSRIEIPISNDGPFLAFAMTWTPIMTNQQNLPTFFLRGSTDGINWMAPEKIQRTAHGPSSIFTEYSTLQLLDAQFTTLQIQVYFPPNSAAIAPDFHLHFFNPGWSTPSIPTPVVDSPESVGELCSCSPPVVLERDDWCPTGNCPADNTPTPTTISHLIVHHSATANGVGDWPAVVRSIWDFHVNVWGWDDIGYNWLIDPNGQLYEGRGQSIQGAHFCGNNSGTTGVCLLGTFDVAPPSGAAQSTLQ
ncbi:MAG: hypothetical protein AAGD05_08950, partial [Bacteroidota bacterium]